MRILVILVAAILSAAPTLADGQSGQVFKSVGQVVNVPVSVTRRGKPVVGLQVSDFLLTDNGQPQQIAGIGSDTVPIDLTLVLDISGSTEASMTLLKKTAKTILTLLKGSDQIRVLAFDATVRTVIPLQLVGSGTATAIESLNSGNATAVHDAILVALLEPVDPQRRHLIVLLSDGEDTFSTTSPESLLAVVSRTNAVLQVGLLRSQPPSGAQTTTWKPFRDLAFDQIRKVAEASGGAVRRLGGWGDGLANAVADYLVEFRASYTLQFVPASSTPGWHELNVTVRGHPEFDLSARRGYGGSLPEVLGQDK